MKRDDRLPGGVWLLALAAAAYLPVFRASLIWNDRDYVTKPALRSWGGLRRIWFELGATEQYYPVLHSAFWVQHRLWGDSSAGYHLCNLALHLLAAGLFARVLQQIGAPWPWFAAAAFAVHPVAVESVAWISEEKNTLSLVFYLAAALAYLRFDDRRTLGWYVVASAWFAAALLSKSVTATLPGALLVVAWWRRGRLELWRDVAPLAPWLAAGAAMGLFTAWVERVYVGAQGAAFALGCGRRLLLASRSFAFYAGKFVWPHPLIFFYPRWVIDPRRPAAYFWPALVALAALACWSLRRRRRGPLAVLLFAGGTLFPVLGFFNVYAFIFSFVADHWQYEALLGWSAAAAALAAAAVAGRTGAVRWLPFALPLIWAALTWRQTRDYRSEPALYAATLQRNPDAWMPHNNLGTQLLAAGKAADAQAEFERALALMPSYPEIHANLGDSLVAQGRLAEARARYEEAVRLEPRYVAAQANLANTLMAMGQPAEAATRYEAALRLNPHDAASELNLGLALLQTGHPREALEHDRAAVRIDPAFPEGWHNLGNALALAGDWDGAATAYAAAVRLRPGYREAAQNGRVAAYRAAEVHANRGAAEAAAGRTQAAAAEYRRALELLPDDPQARGQVEAALREVLPR